MEQPLAPERTDNVLITEAPAIILPAPRRPADFVAKSLELIARATGKALTEKDVYPFRTIAASDGLDSYFTKHDVGGSLEPLARDFAGGLSILGNHDFRTFAYGRSVSGEVVDAEVDAPEYEATFWPKYDQPALRTTKWLVTDAYIARGLTLNGNDTDSIIKGIETGALGKISISFMVGQYRCGIDGHDMLQWWGEPYPDMEEGCAHFPGVEYDEGIGYAVMSETRGLEESIVYKNATPSAQVLAALTAKAGELAKRGLLRMADAAFIQERIGIRLPAFEPALFSVGKEQPSMRKRTAEADGATPEAEATTDPDEPGIVTITGLDAAVESGADLAPEPETPIVEDETPSAEEVVATFVRSSEAVVALAERSADAFAPSILQDVYLAERSIEQVLNDLDSERSVGAEVLRLAEARNRVIAELLGGELTAEKVRRVTERAAIGDTLFEELVREAVAARVSVQGEGFDSAAYAEMLRQSSKVATVRAELTSWQAARAKRYGPSRREVVPGQPDPRRETPRASAPDLPEARRSASDDNVFIPQGK